MPHHRGERNTICGFCVSQLKFTTTSTMLYSHVGRYILSSIQINLGQMYVHYLEHSTPSVPKVMLHFTCYLGKILAFSQNVMLVFV